MDAKQLIYQSDLRIKETQDLIEIAVEQRDLCKSLIKSYPKKLDENVEEFVRDSKCLKRKWQILRDIYKQENLSEEKSVKKIQIKLIDIKNTYTLLISKLDDIIDEIDSLYDLNSIFPDDYE